LQDLRWDVGGPATLNKAAEQFRDQIWTIVENWMQYLTLEEGENIWRRIPETQLVDNLPTLLRGISKVIENPNRIRDFEPEGIIHQVATELGKNRQKRDYKPTEVLREQEILRKIIRQYCIENLKSLDIDDLEQRVNRPLDKMTLTITESYVNTYTGELKELARRDRLTGFLNYEAFKEMLADELKRSRRYRRSFSLAIVDIDDFDIYMDNFGQAAGDLLIQETAKVIAHSVRGVDIPARYGTCEFAIILPESGKKQARKAAERLRRAVKLETRHIAEVRNDIRMPITVSIGISSYPRDSEMVDEMVSLADEALYEAKQAGKDMVVMTDNRKKR